MKPRVLVGIALVIVIGAILVWKTRSRSAPQSAAPTTAPTTKSTSRSAPALTPDPKTPAPQTGDATFERIRREAIGRFNGEVTTRVQLCSNDAGGSGSPPQHRDVRLVLEWKPELSTPEYQTLVVKEVAIIDVGGLTDASRDCLRRATGMQLRIPVPADQLPIEARTFDQIVKLPVP